MAGSLSATGGVSALLDITNFTYSGSTVSSATHYFPMYDGNGNVTSLMKGDGTVAAVYEYGPFGESLRNEVFDPSIGDNPFKFSTKFTDGETGLVYYGQRYYNASLGRFVNRDPIAEQGGLNLYGFCGNDGVNHTDYLGNSWLSRFLGFSRKATRDFLTIGSLGTMRVPLNHLYTWGENHQRELLIAAAIIAAVVTYGAASEWAAAEMTSTVSDTAYLAAAGGPVGGMVAGSAAVAAAAPEIGLVSGIVGGAAAGAVSGVIMTGTVKGTLQGAASGAIMGGISGYYGNTWNLGRVGLTAVGGGAASSASGGSFKQGFEISGAIALITDISYNMRAAMVANSRIDPKNAGGQSVGMFGDAFKLGGGRFDKTKALYLRDGFTINPEQVQPTGGFQGGPGSFLGMRYPVGGFLDHVVESFAGPHDWLGSWWSYDGSGDLAPRASFFGRLFNANTANRVSEVMGIVDIPLAAPFAIASAFGTNSYLEPTINGRH